MPKVSNAYKEEKNTQILDAALNIFMNKPLYEITMLDVVNKLGASKGGVYRYFTDIDHIIVTLINRETEELDYRADIDRIISTTDSYPTAITELIRFLGQYIDEGPIFLAKVQFELTVLLANHPKKAQHYVGALTQQQSADYLMSVLALNISEGIKAGVFMPKVSVDELMMFIMVTVEGAVKNVVLERAYGATSGSLDVKSFFEMLLCSIMNMLNYTN